MTFRGRVAGLAMSCARCCFGLLVLSGCGSRSGIDDDVRDAGVTEAASRAPTVVIELEYFAADCMPIVREDEVSIVGEIVVTNDTGQRQPAYTAASGEIIVADGDVVATFALREMVHIPPLAPAATYRASFRKLRGSLKPALHCPTRLCGGRPHVVVRLYAASATLEASSKPTDFGCPR
jgi:hypothetical protein